MSPTWAVAAVALVSLATLTIGALSMRISRTTSDFYVASRSVSPVLNSTAIGGEYLSAASFLGVAGLVLAHGPDMLWYPVGWTAGYLFLLVLVAAPLRRSGAFTVPDFAQVRLQSLAVRRAATVLVVAVGWLYLLPQFQGAGLTLAVVTGAPAWVGSALVASIVVLNVVAGGMRGITFVQAFQYWLKLSALLVPAFFLVLAWRRDGSPSPVSDSDWLLPTSGGDAMALYTTYSLLAATFLGTMGLPHVVVRFYTNPDGRAARRTTLLVLGLLGGFYLLPTVYGVLGRVYAGDLVGSGAADTVVLALPGRLYDGTAADALGALVTAGAFAAFLSTSCGVTMAIAGVLGQGLSRWADGRGALAARRLPPVTALRVSAVACVVAPLVVALASESISVASSVAFAFALAASTFSPLLLLGIWWRGLTATGALWGLVGGGVAAAIGPVATLAARPDGWLGTLLAQPAAWSAPLGFGLMVVVSLLTRSSVPSGTSRMMVRLHTPEHLTPRFGPSSTV